MILRTGTLPRRVALLFVIGILLAGVSATVAVPADAATGTLTVTTLDRTGTPVRSQFGAIDVKTGDEHYLWTGSAHRLPRGTYDVYVAIATVKIGADTVGVKRIHVSGSARLTIDARQGRPVRGYLEPSAPAGFTGHTSIWLCNAAGSPIVGGGSFDGPAYAIPSSLPEVGMSFGSIWESLALDGHGATYYAGAAVHHKGVPAGMVRTFRQSDLTNFVVHGRTGPQSGDARADVRYGSADPCREVTLQFFPPVTLPYAVTVHGPAGFWSVGQLAQDYVYGTARPYAARHWYSVTAGAAVWGPGGGLPEVDQYCGCLQATTRAMFTDRILSSGASARISYTLSKRGTTIARRTIDPDMATFAPRLRGKGWYLLTERATRNPINPLPRNVLSPRTSVRLHFYADPARAGQIGGYLTRFVPSGLGSDNRARTRTTTLSLRLLRSREPAKNRIPARSVHAWMSEDDGRTWHAVRVRHVHGRWSMTVTNPKAGYVSLRAKVIDSRGNAAVTEVVRAYASR